jgi:zinc/manganese transport system substrate-binding protein
MRRILTALAVVATLSAAACGDDDNETEAGGDRPTIVVTTNILGDVVSEVAGDLAEITTVMPVGADPHDFQVSAQEAAAMREADLLVVNGAGFEEGLLDAIEGAEADGVPVHEAIEGVETLEFGDEEHADEEHADEEGEEEHAEEGGEEEHGHEGTDPHFFTDPTRMAVAVEGIVDAIVEEVPEIDEDALRASADDYLEQLATLDTDVEQTLAVVPEDQRALVTNHEVFGYFADRYDFEVIGIVVPGGTTTGGASAGELAELVGEIEEHDLPAIFADSSSPDELAQTLAAEVGRDVEVVELFSESLGEPGSGGETYLEMVGTNADRIAEALS